MGRWAVNVGQGPHDKGNRLGLTYEFVFGNVNERCRYYIEVRCGRIAC
jgi:hypothetical protein